MKKSNKNFKKSNKDKLSELPLSIKLFNEYGDINNIKKAVRNNLNGNVADIKYNLQGIIDRVQEERFRTIIHFQNFFGPALTDTSNNLLYNNNETDYFYVDFKDYTNYLLDLRNNLEKHLIDLHRLVVLENVKNKAICIINCYTELKSICKKILFAISFGEIDLENLKEIKEFRRFR